MNNLHYCPIQCAPHYLACSNGDIINTDTGNILKPSRKKGGYLEVHIFDKEHKPHYLLVHRVIAECFCENPKGFTEVNHIDGNKDNNNALNLEWVSHADNLKHAYENGLRETDVSPKSIIAICIRTGKKRIFPSIYKAAKCLKISKGNICMCCKNKRPYASGYIFKYFQEGGEGE